MLLLGACAARAPEPAKPAPTAADLEQDRQARADIAARQQAAQREVDEENARRRRVNEEAASSAAARDAGASPAARADADPSPGAAPDAASPLPAADGPTRGERIVAWVDAHCVLEQPASKVVVRCEPVCFREVLTPCAEYKCSSKPPEPDWIGAANAEVCGRSHHQARAVTGKVHEKAVITKGDE